MSRSNLYAPSRDYEATKGALERETAALLAERNQLPNNYGNRQTPRPHTKSAYP